MRPAGSSGLGMTRQLVITDSRRVTAILQTQRLVIAGRGRPATPIVPALPEARPGCA